MKNCNKIIAFLLALIMFVGVTPTNMFVFEAKAEPITETTTTTVGNVAKVGDTEYATIDEAIAAWTNNTTLTLLADVTLSDVIKLSSNEYHILDLGTYTMTAAKGKDAIQYVINGRSSASYALDIKADATNPGGITATGATIVKHTKPLIGAPSKDRPITRFYGGVFNASYIVKQGGTIGAGYTGATSPYFYFYGGVYNGTISTNRSTNIFEGGTFTGDMYMSVDSSAYTLIKGGTFEKLSNLMGSELNSGKFTIGSAKGVYDKEVYVDDNGNYVIAAAEPTEGIEAVVAKTPGTNDYLKYSKVGTEGQLGYTDAKMALQNNNSDSAKVTVYTDTLDMTGINFNGTIVVPEGKTLTITNAPEGLKTEGNVVIVKPVAKIGETSYTSLAEAIAAAQDGDKIVLLADLEVVGETFTIANGKSITLDMNGKKITATDNKAASVSYELFYNYGELTVTGNGTIELTSTSNDTAWAKSSTIFHNRGGVLTIKNGTFKHLGGTAMAYVVDNNANSYGDATTNIIAGTLTSTYVAIRNRMDTYGANGGGNGIATLNISDGSFEGKYAVWGHVSSNGAKGQINISGGTFIAAEGKEAVRVGADATGEIKTAISGGTFSSDVSELCAEGFVCEQNADGTYGVQEDPAYGKVAKIGDAYYATFAEALDAAQNGDTIVLLKNVEFDGGYLYVDMVLDLNGKTITATGSYVFWFKGGSLTVKDSSAEKTGMIDGSATVGNAFLLMGEESLTIESGKIHANNNVIYAAGSGATVTVNGGELKSYIATGNIFYLVSDDDTITVNGGTFIGNVYPYASGLTIYGGLFTADVNAYCAANRGAVKNGDGMYEIIEINASNAAAQIGDKYYLTLGAAINAADDNDTIYVLKDVTESLPTLRGKILPANGSVTITATNSDWLYCAYTFVIGEGVTLNVPALFYYAGGSVIRGDVIAGAYYQRYAGTKLTIEAPGSLTVTGEQFYLRYVENDPNAGIYIIGDNDDSTVELKLSVAYFYQGMINAKDATIVCGTYWQTNETDGQGSANLVLDNSKLTVTVYDHPAKATGNSTVTLKNGSVLDCRNGGFTYGENAVISIDNTSSIVNKDGAEIKFVAKIGAVCYKTLADALAAAQDGDTIVILTDLSDLAITADKTLTITSENNAKLTNVSINGTAGKLTVSNLTFAGNSWINAGGCDELVVKNVTANVTPSNTAYTNSRSAFISLGRSEGQQLALAVENCNIVSLGGSDPILGWAKITSANIIGNTFGSADSHQNYSDSVKFMSVAEGAVLTFNDNTVYSDYNGIVIAQNTTRGNSYVANFNGNTFIGVADHIWIEISGGFHYYGKINASSDNTVNGNAFTAADIKIHTGVIKTYEYYAGVGVVLNSEGKVIGGTFAQINPASIAEGYKLENGVVKIDPAYGKVAMIGENYYATLAEAVAAAQAGDEIVLLANATVEGTLAIPAGVTIKSNGYTINGSIRMLGDLTLNGALTITGGLWVGKSGETLTATLSGHKLTASYFMFQYGTYTINADIDAVYGYLSYNGTFEVNSTIHTTGANGEVLYINGNVTLNDGAVLDSDNSVFLSNAAAVLTMKPGSKVDSNLNITKSGAKLVIDATGLTVGEYTAITGTVTNNGTIEVVNNNKLGAKIVNGKIVLAVKPVAKIGDTYYTSLVEAFKAATEGCTIDILMDVVIDYKWDCRDYATNGSHSQFKESVTINGNGHTIKFTGTVNDNNWNTIFRFEENATVKNLTVDISEATGAQRVISAKKSLTVDGLTIIGSAKYGIIFGEGASAADLAATEIVIKNSTLTGTRRAISDNEGGKDVNSVTITGNTLSANVYVSASENITFNNNTASGEVDLRSYAAENVLSVEAKGNNLTAGVKNYIYAKNIDAQDEFAIERPAFKVSTKAELNAALAAAQDGDTIVLTADIDYGTDQLKIEKAITLDLGGKTLTTRNAYGGMSVKNNPTIKNGTIVHASNTAAIKVWNATAFEDLVIDVQGKGDANKTIGGIVLQSGSTTRVGSIKNVTIKGAALTNGIETYNCGDATENVIGSMEKVTIDAIGKGMLISAPCGTATNCSISGGVNGIEIWIKGNYSASLKLVSSTVEGGVYAHDEFSSNPDIVNNGTLSLIVDEDTEIDDITLTLARAEKVEGILKDIKDNAKAKIGDTYYVTLQAAIDAVKNGDKITLLGDITENVTLTEATGLYYTIDGNGKKMNGTITINSLSDTNDNRRITIKNINFVTDTGRDFITSVNSNHYPRLTVEGCSFTGTGKEIADTVAIRLKSSHSVVIKDCTGTGLHSFLQNTAGWNLTVENVTVTNSKSGLALGTVQGVTVKGCNIDVNGYGVRLDAQYNNDAVIESNTIKAFIPVVVRKAEVSSTITFVGANSMTASNTDGYWMVAGNTEYEENGKLPTAAANVTVNLNDTGLLKTGIFGSNQGVSGTGTWGGIDWTLYADGTLVIAPTKGTPVADKNAPTKRTYEVGEWRERVIYNKNGTGVDIGGAPYDMNKVTKLIIEEGVTYIGSFTAQFPNLVGEVVIPSTVTYIGQEAFSAGSKNTTQNITKLTFAAGGTEGLCIANGAFKYIEITEVSFPRDREYIHIHHWAFQGCTKLETAYIPANVTKCWGGEHVDYFDNFNSQTNVSWTYTSSIFTGCTAMQTITFENEAARDNFFGDHRNSTADDPMVAYAGLVAYNTFNEALAAALENGVTLGLAKSVTINDTIVIPEGKTLTLDLNGKTISQSKACTKSYEMISNNGTLIIKDTFVNSINGAVGGGKISFTDTSAGDPTFGWGSYTIRNAGTLVVENGIIEHKGAQAFGTHMICAIFQYSGSTTINGGTISTPNYRSVRLWKGDMTINGGTFNGQVWVQAADNTSKLTVNGGTFTPKGNDASSVFVSNATYDVEFAVTDGTFNGKIGANNADKLVGVISGGKFNAAAVAGTNVVLLAEGLIFSDEVGADGYYTTVAGLRGAGTETDPYIINTVNDLIFFRDSVNNGDTKYNAPGVYVALAADIDLAGINWVGIGSATAEHGFMGNFDGKGFKIKNLTITNPALDSDGYAYAGLFAVTEGTDKDNQNTIKNLIIENVTIKTTGHIVAAAIAYPYYTIVDNVTVCGNIAIEGGNYTAGVLAYTRRCVNASNLTISGNSGSYIKGAQTVGGVISDIQMNGGLTAVYSNFSASGLTITGTKQVGGISGIIANQTLNGATVKNVTLVCDDARVGIVAGSLGGISTISNVTIENVTGATAIVGATYDAGVAVQAKIGDTYYTTLDAALKAAKAGDVINLLTTYVVEKGETKELNLPEGVTVSMVTDDVKMYALILNYGNLTITGEGKLSYKYNGNDQSDAHNTIESAPGSVLTIKGGTIENLSENCLIAYAIDGLTNGNGGDVTVNIEGGKISSKKIAVRIFANSTTNTGNLNISGGEISGRVIIQSANANANKAALNVTGGTFNTNGYKADVLYVGGTGNASGITASVSGGTFDGEILSTTGKGFISGGIFNAPVAEEFCAEGYIPTENAGGTYGVKVGKYVSRNTTTGVGYETIDAAIAAAQTGETVTILAGNYTTNISVNKAITVVGETDANGNNLVNISGRVSVSTGATVKNLNVHNEKKGTYDCALVVDGKDIVIDGVKLTGYNAMRYCYATGNITIKNSTINGSNFAVHFDGKAGGNVVFENCNITGWCSYASTVNSVSYTDCNLNQGNTAGHRYYNKNISFTDCDFAEGFKIDLTASGSNVAFIDDNMALAQVAAMFKDPYYVAKGNITLNETKVTYAASVYVNGASKYFMTLQEAIDAAPNGNYITLRSNNVLTAPITIPAGKKVTIGTMDGFTITYTSDKMGEAMITNNGDLTLEEVKVIYTYTGAADSAYGKGNYTIANNGKLTITNATIENATAQMKHASYAITNGNGGEIVLKSGLIKNTNNYAVRMFGNGSLTVNGGEIIGTRVVWMQAPGSNAADAPAISLVVNGGKLTATGESAEYKLAVYSYTYGNSLKNVSITVNGGVVDGDIALSGGANKTVAENVTITGGSVTNIYSYADDEVAAKTINISGGVFQNSVPEIYCAEGYIPADLGNGTYGVKVGKFVARNTTTGVGYETLADAIAAAQNGETVVLLSDIELTESVTVPAGKTITLDLNGKTISSIDTTNKSFSLITNKGELTITGNGKITLTATQDTGYNRSSSVISNTVGGKLVIESGTIEHLGGHTMAYAIDNLTNGKGTYAETVIEGGTIKSSYVGIRQFLNGAEAQNILTVNGGTVTGNNTSIFFQDPSKNCNSGKLTVGDGAVLGNRVYISGTEGTAWNVEVAISAQALGTNGIVTDEIPETSVIKEVNGVYGFVQSVASVDGIGYATLADAFAAVKAGDTIKLLRPATEAILMVPAGVTLNLNGKYVTAGNVFSFGNIIDNNGTTDGLGGIVISNDRTKAFVQLQQNNTYLPIYDTTYDDPYDMEGCYRFFGYMLESKDVVVVGDGAAKFRFRIRFGSEEAYRIMAESKYTGISLALDLKWDKLAEDDAFETYSYAYDIGSETIADDYFLATYDAELRTDENGLKYSAKLIATTVTGVPTGNIYGTPVITSVTGVSGSGSELTREIQSSDSDNQ